MKSPTYAPGRKVYYWDGDFISECIVGHAIPDDPESYVVWVVRDGQFSALKVQEINMRTDYMSFFTFEEE